MDTRLVFFVLLLLALLALIYGMEWLFIALFVLLLALVLARFGAREAPEEPPLIEPSKTLEKERVVVVQRGAPVRDFVSELVSGLVRDTVRKPREEKRHHEALQETASLKKEIRDLAEMPQKKDKK